MFLLDTIELILEATFSYFGAILIFKIRKGVEIVSGSIVNLTG